MKWRILALLKSQPGEYLSGEQISADLGVSRAAVWKAVQALSDMGYQIESKTRSGYRYLSAPDRLYPAEIRPYLHTKRLGKACTYLATTPSTNLYALSKAPALEEEGYLVIAEEQTGGLARLHGRWTSFGSQGIYFSLALFPALEPAHLSRVTMLAACALSAVIEEETGLVSQTGWPNALLIDGKKYCGILTQMSGEVEKIDFVVLGIGIQANVAADQIPPTLQGQLTSLLLESGRPVSRPRLLAAFLNRFDKLYDDFLTEPQSFTQIHADFCARCPLLGQLVRLRHKEKIYQGICTDINIDGALSLKDAQGQSHLFFSGELLDMRPPESKSVAGGSEFLPR